MTTPEISVVIPTFNGGRLFSSTLEGIRGQDVAVPYELVVIDSGSTDQTVEEARRAGARILTLPNAEFNHGDTRDRAIRECRGSFIALTVQDAQPADPHWLDGLRQALEEVPNAAGAYSRQIPRPDLNPILKDRLERWSASRTERAIQRLEETPFDSLEPLSKLSLVAFDNVSSCLRRSDWEEQNFGRQRFGEDIRWATMRVVAGRSIVFEPRSAVIHSHDSPVWYEFRRIFADHRNLSDLLGIVTVPDIQSIRRNARHAREGYFRLLESCQLEEGEKKRLTHWARRYAWAENLAQYLGARATRADRSGTKRGRLLTRILERWLAGV